MKVLQRLWQEHQIRAQQARMYRDKKRELAKMGKEPGSYMGYLPTATWLRRVLYNRFGWSLTSQNLTKDGGPLRHRFWSGRSWLSRWDQKRDKGAFQLSVDWQHGRRVDSLRLMLHVGGGDAGRDVTASLSIPRLFSYWVTLEDVVRGTYRGYNHNEREYGLSVYEDHVTLRWHYHDSGAWHSDKKKNKEANPGGYMSFFWRDKVLGKADYSKAITLTERAIIPMPEGPYPATVEISRAVWKRPRWPFAKVIYRAEITPDTPVGTPGKGENAWDCEDDATYSMTTPANTVEEAVTSFVESTLKRRRQYGGPNWIPSKVS